jgi:hypothetical protein
MGATMPDRETLPAHRKLTEAERRGFRMACACMQTWGVQLVATSLRPGRDGALPAQNSVGRQLAYMAEALDLQAAKGCI